MHHKVEVITIVPLVTEEIERVDCTRPDLVCAPDTFPYEVGAVNILTGEAADKFSAQWRKLERDYLHNDDKCLPADHLLRFYQNDKLLLESRNLPLVPEDNAAEHGRSESGRQTMTHRIIGFRT